jgi:hypothetical protein
MVGLMVIIPAIVYLVLRPGSQGYLSFWSLSFIGLLTQPSFYVRWLELLNTMFGSLTLVIAFAGVVILQPKARFLMVGLWLGYVLFGLSEPWQIHTHDYYSLILVPILAFSLASVASAYFSVLSRQPKFWQFAFVAVAIFALAIPAWKVRLDLAEGDSRTNWAAWKRLGEALPSDGKMIALTDDYGTYVEYFGLRETSLWPTSQDLRLVAARGGNLEPDFEKNFATQTSGMDYFLVTALYDLENQLELKEYLYNHYPYTEGDGYLLFDLKSPLNSP